MSAIKPDVLCRTEHFRKALDLMNRAVSNPGQPLNNPPPQEKLPYTKEPIAPQHPQRYEVRNRAPINSQDQCPCRMEIF